MILSLLVIRWEIVLIKKGKYAIFYYGILWIGGREVMRKTADLIY